MIPRYLATLAIAVALVTLAASSLQFDTRSHVLSGTAVDETLPFEFTIDADDSSTYQITPAIAEFLRTHITLRTTGSTRVTASEVEVTPKDVSWTENRHTTTSTGAAMTAKFHWDTPSNSPNGAPGVIYLNFPEVPGLEGKTVSFHSGPYQKDGEGRYIIGEVTTYQSSFQLFLGRFVFALAAGLPFGILLHTIFWAFVLKGEKRARLADLTLSSPGLPETFYPSPVAEWTTWLFVLAIGVLMAAMVAAFSIFDGFMSSSMMSTEYFILAIAVVIALLVVFFTRRSLLTVRIAPEGISYARGRDDLQWLSANWSDIRSLTQKSRKNRGNTTYWVEVEFNDGRKKLKISQSIEGYPALRDRLLAQRVARTT